MRLIVAIVLLLCLTGILVTPSVEDDVDGTKPLSVAQAGNGVCQELSLIVCGSSPAIGSSSQPETAHILRSVIRC